MTGRSAHPTDIFQQQMRQTTSARSRKELPVSSTSAMRLMIEPDECVPWTEIELDWRAYFSLPFSPTIRCGSMNRSLLLALLAIWAPSICIADTVEISGGGNLEGHVQRKTDATIITVDDDIQVAIRGSRVLRVIPSDQLEEYRDLVSKIGDDANLHYQLGIWCVSKSGQGGKNVPGDSQHYKRYHMERAIALDSEHANARASLGYKKEKGVWVLTADLMRDRGMVKTGSGWGLPELVAIGESQDSTNVAVKRWNKDVARLTKNVLRKVVTPRDATRHDEALSALEAIRDPLASSAIAHQLKESRGNREQSQALRLIWVRLLGSFRTSVSVRALVLAGVAEDNEAIRDAAFKQLLQYGSGSAVATYLPMLKPPNDNNTINRAARALSWFPDPELALEYVNALVTTHTSIGPPQAGTNQSFGDRGSGMSQGGKPQVIKRKLPNPSVLALVKTIEPDVDYGYDEKAWRQYFADQRAKFTGDLRRDP